MELGSRRLTLALLRLRHLMGKGAEVARMRMWRLLAREGRGRGWGGDCSYSLRLQPESGTVGGKK